jgi:hypothetical protein
VPNLLHLETREERLAHPFAPAHRDRALLAILEITRAQRGQESVNDNSLALEISIDVLRRRALVCGATGKLPAASGAIRSGQFRQR